VRHLRRNQFQKQPGRNQPGESKSLTGDTIRAKAESNLEQCNQASRPEADPLVENKNGNYEGMTPEQQSWREAGRDPDRDASAAAGESGRDAVLNSLIENLFNRVIYDAQAQGDARTRGGTVKNSRAVASKLLKI